MILANDDRPRTMHAHAELTVDRHQLPPIVAALLNRNDQRRTSWREAWREHSAAARAREAAVECLLATSRDTSHLSRSRSVDQDYGLEL